MSRQVIKPEKGASRMSFFVGLAFCAFGIFMLVQGIFSPEPLVIVPFSCLWLLICIFNTIRSFKNGFTEDGPGIYEINTMESNKEDDFALKLRNLQQLRLDNLISVSEYNQKRAEIIKKQW